MSILEKAAMAMELYLVESGQTPHYAKLVADQRIRSIAAAPEAQAQEPAAWLEITDDGDIIGASIVRDTVELPKGWRWEPVYRRPTMNDGGT